MDTVRLTTIAASLHVMLVAAALYYTLRVSNHAELSEISVQEFVAMGAILALPVLSASIGLRLARTSAARRLLAVGQTAALLGFAAAFAMVLRSFEPMAPLLFLLVSLWLAAGLSVLLAVVWLVARRGR